MRAWWPICFIARPDCGVVGSTAYPVPDYIQAGFNYCEGSQCEQSPLLILAQCYISPVLGSFVPFWTLDGEDNTKFSRIVMFCLNLHNDTHYTHRPMNAFYSFIHSLKNFYSASSKPLLFTSAPDSSTALKQYSIVLYCYLLQLPLHKYTRPNGLT